MVNDKRLIMSTEDAISKAEQELSTSRYIAECTRSPGMRAIHDKRCAWLSVIVALAKKAIKMYAVEVVHGRWIEKPNPWGQDGSHSYDCSVCGERTCVVGEKLRYCPNCGAKMDGGNEE